VADSPVRYRMTLIATRSRQAGGGTKTHVSLRCGALAGQFETILNSEINAVGRIIVQFNDTIFIT
jgi:hypothetical protein